MALKGFNLANDNNSFEGISARNQNEAEFIAETKKFANEFNADKKNILTKMEKF